MALDKRKAVVVIYAIICVAVCSGFLYDITNLYFHSTLVCYENKDVRIGKAIGKTKFGYLYRSLSVENKSGNYTDSSNSSRPLVINAFRWVKFPSIHRYIFLKHDELAHAHHYYFYLYKTSHGYEIFGLSANKKPANLYVLLDVVSYSAVFAFIFLLIPFWILNWLTRKKKNASNEKDLSPGYYLNIAFGLLLVYLFV